MFKNNLNIFIPEYWKIVNFKVFDHILLTSAGRIHLDAVIFWGVTSDSAHFVTLTDDRLVFKQAFGLNYG